MRPTTILVLLLLAPHLLVAQQPTPQGLLPPHGFVPDSATAVRIAVAVWIPIFGEGQIMGEQPFIATLKDSVWTVTGSLPRAPKGYGVVGGTAVAKIAQRDARILFVTHYR
jgi:NTF2 fold immunity protein